jgi:NADH dehydrogenase FAD-containing subunit
LASLPWPQGVKPEITLVDRSEKFVFKPLLYELLNGGVEPGEVPTPHPRRPRKPLFPSLLLRV